MSSGYREEEKKNVSEYFVFLCHSVVPGSFSSPLSTLDVILALSGHIFALLFSVTVA